MINTNSAQSRNSLSPVWWAGKLPRGVTFPAKYAHRKLVWPEEVRAFLAETAESAGARSALPRFMLGLAEQRGHNVHSVSMAAADAILAGCMRTSAFDDPSSLRRLRKLALKDSEALAGKALFALCQLPGFEDMGFIRNVRALRYTRQLSLSADQGGSFTASASPLYFDFLRTLLIKRSNGTRPLVGKARTFTDIGELLEDNASFISSFLGGAERKDINAWTSQWTALDFPQDRLISPATSIKMTVLSDAGDSTAKNTAVEELKRILLNAYVSGPAGCSRWPKDDFVLAATRYGYVPVPSSPLSLKGGEVVSGIGRKGPFALVSSMAPAGPLAGALPCHSIYTLPPGFLNLRWKDISLLLLTSHIDTVMGSVPVEASEKNTVILIDPDYHRNIKDLESCRLLKDEEGVVFVDVPEQERWLNPANMAFSPEGKLIIPYAPLTRMALIKAGVKGSHILMLPELPESSLLSVFLLAGGIGCLVGQKINADPRN